MGLPLFLIKQTGNVGYDCAAAFIVAAENEDVVRVWLSSPFDADYDGENNNLHAGDEGGAVWLDESKSACKVIAPDSVYDELTIVLKDFLAG